MVVVVVVVECTVEEEEERSLEEEEGDLRLKRSRMYHRDSKGALIPPTRCHHRPASTINSIRTYR